METVRRANIDHHISGPYHPEENPAEGGILSPHQQLQYTNEVVVLCVAVCG